MYGRIWHLAAYSAGNVIAGILCCNADKDWVLQGYERRCRNQHAYLAWRGLAEHEIPAGCLLAKAR
jgi:hypothetical protein